MLLWASDECGAKAIQRKILRTLSHGPKPGAVNAWTFGSYEGFRVHVNKGGRFDLLPERD